MFFRRPRPGYVIAGTPIEIIAIFLNQRDHWCQTCPGDRVARTRMISLCTICQPRPGDRIAWTRVRPGNAIDETQYRIFVSLLSNIRDQAIQPLRPQR